MHFNPHIWICSIFENRNCGVASLLKYHELNSVSIYDLLRLKKLKIQVFLGGGRVNGLLSHCVSVRMVEVNYGEEKHAVAQPPTRY